MQKVALALLFSAQFPLFAQTGPGGVSSGTTNLLLWLDSQRLNDDGSNPNVGDAVVTWYDQSGNNIDVTRNTANVATYGATGVTFNDTGYLLGSDASLPSGNSPRSVIICASSPSTDQDDALFFYGDAPFTNRSYGILKIASTNGTYPNGVRGFFFGNDLDVANGFIPSGTLKIITSTYQANSHSLYVNNGGASTDNAGFPANTVLGDGLQVGGWGQYGPTLSSATIAEVIFYNKLLNTAEIRIVNNYLAAKYGLSISNELYDEDNAGNGNYDYDVAGIGQASAGANNLDAQGSIVRINGATGLGNAEYYLWGHDNGALIPTTSGIPAGVQARLTRIWRGSETGTITNFDVRFDLTGLGNVVAADLRLLVDTDNDNSFTDEVNGTGIISGATLVSGNIYEFPNVTVMNDGRRFTLATANTTTTPLPIELLSFDVTKTKNNVTLHWTTAAEIDNDFFDIERSADANVWTTIGQMKGAGTSQELLSYEFIDQLPHQGRNYYRLKQVDYNGNFEYSILKSIVFNYDNTLFPNPTTGILNLINKDDNGDLAEAAVFNTMGQNISEKVTITYLSPTQLKIDLSPLPPGVYLIKTKNTSNLISKE